MAIGLKMVQGDFVIENKKISIVSDFDKLKRDLLKFLVTSVEDESNYTPYYRYNPNYGLGIDNHELYKNLNVQLQIDLINNKLAEALNYYVSLQESRDNISFYEVISNIDFMVYQSPTDRQTIKIQIFIYTPDGNKQEIGTFNQTVG